MIGGGSSSPMMMVCGAVSIDVAAINHDCCCARGGDA